MHASATRPSPNRRRRRRHRPPWWVIALVQVAGSAAAAFCVLIAVFSAPRYGLFGVENDGETRLAGALATLGAGVGVASGALLVGIVRRDRSWLASSLVVAGAIALALWVVLTAGGHGGLAAAPVGQAVSTQ